MVLLHYKLFFLRFLRLLYLHQSWIFHLQALLGRSFRVSAKLAMGLMNHLCKLHFQETLVSYRLKPQ